MSADTELEQEAPEATPDPFDMDDEQLAQYEVDMVPEASEEADTDETDPEDEDETEDTETDEESDVDPEEEPEETDPEEGEESTEEEEPEEVDYKAEYEKLMAPFKANGKEITTTSAEEVIKLKQMGANYTKKMVELKPHLKVTKMLQKNGLLDEGKLNYLIDLSNKEPAAIAQLIKDSGIDPLEINTESEEYTPKNHSVSNKEVNLDEVLSQIEATPTYERTIDIVGNKWDDSSKEVLSAKPEMIAAINDHIASGVYDKIEAEIDKQQMFGGLQGLSDLEVYQKVGKDLFEKGAFNEKKPEPVKRSKPKAKQSDAVRNLKKRAASPTKTAPKKKEHRTKDTNYFDLSDEELNNVSPNLY